MSEHVRTAASAAADNPMVEAGARLGYAASGVLHLLIAWIARQLAWFHSGARADQSGALQQLGSTGAGSVALWIALAGFGVLGIWQLIETVVRRELGARVKSAGKGVVYLALAFTTVAVARGARSSGSPQTVDFTATLMSKPFGRVMVALIGLAVIGVGGYHMVKRWRATLCATCVGTQESGSCVRDVLATSQKGSH